VAAAGAPVRRASDTAALQAAAKSAASLAPAPPPAHDGRAAEARRATAPPVPAQRRTKPAGPAAQAAAATSAGTAAADQRTAPLRHDPMAGARRLVVQGASPFEAVSALEARGPGTAVAFSTGGLDGGGAVSVAILPLGGVRPQGVQTANARLAGGGSAPSVWEADVAEMVTLSGTALPTVVAGPTLADVLVRLLHGRAVRLLVPAAGSGSSVSLATAMPMAELVRAAEAAAAVRVESPVAARPAAPGPVRSAGTAGQVRSGQGASPPAAQPGTDGVGTRIDGDEDEDDDDLSALMAGASILPAVAPGHASRGALRPSVAEAPAPDAPASDAPAPDAESAAGRAAAPRPSAILGQRAASSVRRHLEGDLRAMGRRPGAAEPLSVTFSVPEGGDVSESAGSDAESAAPVALGGRVGGAGSSRRLTLKPVRASQSAVATTPGGAGATAGGARRQPPAASGAWGSRGMESVAALSSSSESDGEPDPGAADKPTLVLIDDVSRAFASVFSRRAMAAKRAAAMRHTPQIDTEAALGSVARRQSRFQSRSRRLMRRLRSRPVPQSLLERHILVHPRPALVATIESAFVDRTAAAGPGAAIQGIGSLEDGPGSSRALAAAPPTPGSSALKRTQSAAAAPGASHPAHAAAAAASRSVVKYVVVVEELGQLRWRVRLRFSDFFAVHLALRDSIAGFDVPFPPKNAARSMFGGGFDDSFVRDRRARLGSWLLRCLTHPIAGISAELRALLGPRKDTAVERVGRQGAGMGASFSDDEEDGDGEDGWAAPRAPAERSLSGPGSSPTTPLGAFRPGAGVPAEALDAKLAGRTGPPLPEADLSMEAQRRAKAETVGTAREVSGSSSCSVFVAMRDWDAVAVWPFHAWASAPGAARPGAGDEDGEEEEEDEEENDEAASEGAGAGGAGAAEGARPRSPSKRGRAASAASAGPAGPAWRTIVRHGEIRRRPVLLSPEQFVRAERSAFAMLAGLMGSGQQGFVRRNLLAMLRRMGRSVYRGTMSKSIKRSFRDLTSVPEIARYVAMCREAVWPGGVFPTVWPERHPDDEMDTRDAALLALVDAVPQSLFRLLGRRPVTHGMVRLHAMMNCAPLMRSLAYSLLDRAFKHLVPPPPRIDDPDQPAPSAAQGAARPGAGVGATIMSSLRRLGARATAGAAPRRRTSATAGGQETAAERDLAPVTGLRR